MFTSSYLKVDSIAGIQSGQGTSGELKIFPTFLTILRVTGTLSKFNLVLEGKTSAKDFLSSDAKELVTIKNRGNSKFASVSTLFAIYAICEKMQENSFLGNERSAIITINKFVIFNNPSATISNLSKLNI